MSLPVYFKANKNNSISNKCEFQGFYDYLYGYLMLLTAVHRCCVIQHMMNLVSFIFIATYKFVAYTPLYITCEVGSLNPVDSMGA